MKAFALQLTTYYSPQLQDQLIAITINIHCYDLGKEKSFKSTNYSNAK